MLKSVYFRANWVSVTECGLVRAQCVDSVFAAGQYWPITTAFQFTLRISQILSVFDRLKCTCFQTFCFYSLLTRFRFSIKLFGIRVLGYTEFNSRKTEIVKAPPLRLIFFTTTIIIMFCKKFKFDNLFILNT